MSLVFAAQTYALSVVQKLTGTNNPALDAVVTTSLIALLAYIGRQWPSVFERLKKSCTATAPPSSASRHSLRIPKFEHCVMEGNKVNQLYDSFVWFVTEMRPCKNGQMVAFKYISATFVPENGVTHEFEWEGKSFQYTFRASETKEAHEPRNVNITLACEDADALVNFGTQMTRLHAESRDKRSWRQKLFTHSRGSDWGSELTHNAKTWKSVVLPADLKRHLVNDITTFMDSEDWYREMGVSWKRGLLLCGKPGTGKTSIIKAISNVHKMHIYSVKLDQVSDDVALGRLLRNVPPRSAVIFEDVDAMSDIVLKRTEAKTFLDDKKKQEDVKETDDRWGSKVTLSGLLNVIDGVSGGHGIVFVMTTNHKDKLDPALVRAGRCDLHLELPLCTHDMITEMYMLFIGHSLPEDIIFPDNVLSPATVSSVLLTHRLDGSAALKILQDECRN